MIMEIIVGVIALALVFLVIFIILALKRMHTSLNHMDRIMGETKKAVEEISEPAEHLVQNLNKLTVDIKKKSEGLDILFHPLYALQGKKTDKTDDRLTAIVECVADVASFLQKIKTAIKG